MHFNFSSLLTGILLAISVQALPRPKPKTGFVTLPLKRIEQRSDVHPLIAHQQNINRSHRRYARMTGREVPSDAELANNLRKRVLSIEEDGDEGLTRRYNRVGVPSRINSQTKAKTTGSGAVLAGATAKNKNAAAAQGGQRNRNGAAGAQRTRVGQNGATSGQRTKQGQNGGATGNSTGKANGKTTTGVGGAGGATGNAANQTASGAAAQPDVVTPAGAPSGQNSLGLDIEANDIGYLATIKMGTPPRNFLILMDSGSADLWVGAENCKSDAGGGCGNHNFLGPQGSNTFKATNTPFQVTYGTGQVSGNVIQDNIDVAGLKLTGHTFGVATTESVEFSDNTTPFDGLMGLAQSTLSQQQTLTPIEALAKAGLVQDAITSYKISRLLDNKNDGEITFGGLDTTKFDAQTLVNVPNVSQQGFWEANMDAVSVDGQNLGLQGRTAILDTGTTLIIAPAADATAVHQQIQGAKSDGQGGFTVPCNTQASVALSFGGATFAIDPRDIAFQPVNAADPNGDCISGIASGNVGGANEWLVGDVFLKNAYFSTDVGKNTLSLAKLV